MPAAVGLAVVWAEAPVGDLGQGGGVLKGTPCGRECATVR